MIFFDIINPEHPRYLITMVNGNIVPKTKRPISTVPLKDKISRLLSYVEENYRPRTVTNLKTVIKDIVNCGERSFRSYTSFFNKYRKNKYYRSHVIFLLLFDFYDVLGMPDGSCKTIEFSSSTYYQLSWEHQLLIDDFTMCAATHHIGSTINTGICNVTNFLHYLERCGINDLHDITETVIREYHINNKTHPMVLNRIKCRLKDYAEIHSDVKLQEIIKLFPPTKKKSNNVYLPMLESERSKLETFLLDPSTKLIKRDRAIGILILYTGLRCSDVSKIKKTDVNLSTCDLHVVQQKTGTHIHIPLLPVVSNAIIDYVINERPKVDSSLLFLPKNIRSIKIPPRDISVIMNNIYNKAGIERRGAHILRHNIANKMINEGVDIATISGILGHSNINMTEQYISANIEQLRACALSISKFPIKSKLYEDYR